jgi:histone deacetylase HOS2
MMTALSKPSPVPVRENSVVQTYEPNTPEPQPEAAVFRLRDISPFQKQAMIEEEVEKNGIERPKDYTVSFHYNTAVEYHHFGRSHPMKPWRLTLTKQLVLAYGLQYAMDVYDTLPATFEELNEFHDENYLTFLRKYV